MDIFSGKVRDIDVGHHSFLSNERVYYNPEYCAVVAELEKGGDANFFLVVSGDNYVYYQFVKRDIAYAGSHLEVGEYFDITTPFDYGGLYYNNVELLSVFFDCFAEFCCQERIVSEFIRFNPLYSFHSSIVEKHLLVRKLREQVFIDLESEYYSQYEKSRKRNILKAQKKYNYTFTVIDIEQFYSIYLETMDRIEANPYYYFDKQVLQKIVAKKLGHFRGVRIDDKLASVMLILEEDDNVYYMLGGTRTALLHTNIFSVLIHSVAGEFFNKKKRFLLGGGNDSVYSYKKRFSGIECRAPYSIGMKIHNEKIYSELTENITKEFFFPAYREKIV